MRKAVFILAAGAIFASVILLTLFDVTPKGATPPSDPESAASGTPNSGVSQVPQTEVYPPADVLGTASSRTESAVPAGEIGAGERMVSIPTPPEFDLISADEKAWHHESWRRLHAMLEREPIDPAWSHLAEAALRDAINERQEFARYTTPTVNCRTTLCEAQMMVYGVSDIDEFEWSKHMGAVYKKLKPDYELEDFSVAQENGATAMVLHLFKRESPANDQGR